MFNNLGRLFESLDSDSGGGPLAAGRGSVGSIRSFHLPFIPEECCGEEEPLIPLEDEEGVAEENEETTAIPEFVRVEPDTSK